METKENKQGCGKVAMRVYSTGEYIAIKCGEMFSGKLRLCEKCKLEEAKE